MLVDEVTVQFKAGSGGRGAVEFNKVKMMLGPVGGSGGEGGSVYLEGVPDISALAPLAGRNVMRAGAGDNGRGGRKDGKVGQDLVVPVPLGTRVVTVETGEARAAQQGEPRQWRDITKAGDRLLVAAGGQGGRGNFLFRSSRNTSPQQFEEGKPGEVVTLRLELRLIAQVGLVGLPNAGKSSLLNELTGAHSRVGSYPFTTLEPSLGAYYGLIIADIPGLIEGAAAGKGLGVKFLKHIERTEILFHLVSAESDDVVGDYETIRGELEEYNPALVEKEEYVLLSHADMVEEEVLQQKLAELGAVSERVMPVSVIDDASLKEVKQLLNEIKDKAGISDSVA